MNPFKRTYVASFYLKSGQTIRIPHVTACDVRTDDATGEIIHYFLKWRKWPKQANMISIPTSQISAIVVR